MLGYQHQQAMLKTKVCFVSLRYQRNDSMTINDLNNTWWIRCHFKDGWCDLMNYYFKDLFISSWHHQIETFSMLLAFCEGNPPVTGGFPSQRPVMQICAWTNDWANNAGDLRCHHAHNDVTVMILTWSFLTGRELRSGVKCIVVTIVTGSLWFERRYRWGQVNLKTISTIPSH